MELIERYVRAVAERLPEDTRSDVARELRANIEDMLPDGATEQDVRKVLEKMGSPAALANEYRQSKRYLIGPGLYDTYVFVLKIVLCIAPVAIAFLSLAGAVLDGGSAVDVIAAAIGGAFEGAVQAFIWVTLVFAILERAGVDEGSLPFGHKDWTVDDLPPAVQNPRSKIDRAEEVVAIIFIVAFMSIFVLRPELIGWYDQADGGLQVATLFDLDRLQAYIPAIVVLAVMSFGLSVCKIVAGRWTLPLAGANTLVNLGNGLLACIMLTDRGLWNPAFIDRLEGLFEVSAGTLDAILASGVTAAIVVIVLLLIMDSVMGFLKSKEVRLLDIPERIRAWIGGER